jgi:hypothetical protein
MSGSSVMAFRRTPDRVVPSMVSRGAVRIHHVRAEPGELEMLAEGPFPLTGPAPLRARRPGRSR